VLASGHVLLFPSIREFGGGVVLEAMAGGVVPVVVDYGGPAEIVDESSGYRIPLASSDDSAARITNILQELCASPERFEALSAGAKERIRTSYTWEAKAQASLSVYRHVTGLAGRPSLDPPPAAS
jgi:starch synthase